MTNKKRLIRISLIIVSLLILLFGSFYLFKPSKKSPSSSNQKPITITVGEETDENPSKNDSKKGDDKKNEGKNENENQNENEQSEEPTTSNPTPPTNDSSEKYSKFLGAWLDQNASSKYIIVSHLEAPSETSLYRIALQDSGKPPGNQSANPDFVDFRFNSNGVGKPLDPYSSDYAKFFINPSTHVPNIEVYSPKFIGRYYIMKLDPQ